MKLPEQTDYNTAIKHLPFMTAEVQEAFRPGRIVELSPLVRRITAPNPGMMTGPGTNTFIIGQGRLTVIDPGPASVEHIEAIANYCNGKIDQILLTHTHPDHSPGAALLHDLTGAPVGASGVELEQVYDDTFVLDQQLQDGDFLQVDEYCLEVIHTPGHVANHLCFLLNEPQWLFAGDMVMDGSTVVIAPPDGNMADYVDSLERLKTRSIESIAPAHGRLIPDPPEFFQSMIDHRAGREQKVVSGLQQLGIVTIEHLVKNVYDDVPEVLHGAALMSLQAHLFKLQGEDIAVFAEGSQEWQLKS